MAAVSPAPAGGPPADQQAALQRLKIWQALKEGKLHNITKKMVEDLFVVLDTEEESEITKKHMLALTLIPEISLTEEDIDNIVADCDKDGSGKVSQEELYEALTQGKIAYEVVMANLGHKKVQIKSTECQKDDLIEFVRYEYETSTSLWSLPQTLILFVAFILASTYHIEPNTGFHMQDGLLGEIEGEGDPYLHKYVHDVPTFWVWMQSSFANLFFKNDLDIWPYPGRVASYNQMIGGIELIRTNSVPGECGQSPALRYIYDPAPLDMDPGTCHKTDDTYVESNFLLYHESWETIKERIANMTDTRWISQNTTSLDISILFYNAHLKAFTAHHLLVGFQWDGVVKIVFDMETFLADPYHDISVVVPDIIFGVILARMFYGEFLELVPACMNGLDGFFAYMGFWNIVDWLSILGGGALMGMWAALSVQIGGPFQELLAELPSATLDELVLTNRTYLTPDQFEAGVPGGHEAYETKVGEIHSMMDEIKTSHDWVRRVIFIYNFVLMMKFFKAFQANPRLNVVIKTVTVAAIDMIHFFLVFMVIFLVFSSSAFVFFGPKIEQFRDHIRSIMMCWRILMGEFDVDTMELVQKEMAYIWIFAFQWIVLLILLNMLLAIIMDTYSAVNEQGAMTIWAQVGEAVRTVRETRGHIDLWFLLCELEDEDNPAHTAPRVTRNSLRRAFEQQKMTKHNSDYLIRKTVEFVAARSEKLELKLSDAIRLISQMRISTQRSGAMTEEVLDMMKQDRAQPQHARFAQIWDGHDPDTMGASLPGNPPGGGMMGGGMMANSGMQSGMGANPAMMGTGMTQNMQMTGVTQSGLNPAAGQLALTGGDQSMYGTSNMQSTAGSKPFMSASQVKKAALHNADVGAGGPNSGNMAMSNGFSTLGGGAAAPMGGGLGGGPELQQVMAQLAQLQSSMDQIKRQLRDSEDVPRILHDEVQTSQERYDWLEQRLNALDRRCEKVERASDRVSSSMQGFDFGELMNLSSKLMQGQRQIVDEMQSGGGGGGGGGNNDTLNLTLGSNANQDFSQTAGSAPSSNRRHHMEHQVDKINEGVVELLSHAEEGAEQRKLLWKIDMSLRAIRNMPAQATSPPPHNNLTPQRSMGMRRQSTKDEASIGAGTANSRNSTKSNAQQRLSQRLPPVADVPDAGDRTLRSPPGPTDYPGDPRPSDNPDWQHE